VSAEQGAMDNENLPLEGSACRFRALAREQTRTCCGRLDKAAGATGGVTRAKEGCWGDWAGWKYGACQAQFPGGPPWGSVF